MVKRLLVAFALLCAVSAKVHAQSPKTYVGLYADANHSMMCVFGVGSFYPFDLWIWWLPSVNGLQASMVKIATPANVIVATVMSNPLTNPFGCDFVPTGGICAVFYDCQHDWVWSHHAQCYLLDGDPSFITIGPPVGQEPLRASSCLPGYPLEPVIVFNVFGLNTPAFIAAENRSWGAIKGIYR